MSDQQPPKRPLREIPMSVLTGDLTPKQGQTLADMVAEKPPAELPFRSRLATYTHTGIITGVSVLSVLVIIQCVSTGIHFWRTKHTLKAVRKVIITPR